jgi:SWI/SNF-related matrix-associated actin-dependent regulator 1 of chromatin subfamily A
MIRYCGGVKNQWGGWETTGATNMEELYDKLKSVMIRRTKDTINLPPKEIIYTKISCGTQRRMIKRLMKNHYHESGGPLKIISMLKQDAALKKVATGFKWDERPIVIFYHHKEVAHLLESNFRRETNFNVAKIDGSTSDIDRSIITAEFQSGKYQVLLASMTAAGVGITLTAASRAIMLEQAWSPADEKQCHDRLHRIGQTKPVTIEYLIGSGTIDEVIQKVVQDKSEMIDSIVDGASVKSVMVRNVMKELMR